MQRNKWSWAHYHFFCCRQQKSDSERKGEETRSFSANFPMSTACYTTWYVSFPTELASKEYLLFKGISFFVLYSLRSRANKKKCQAGFFQCLGQCHAIFPGRLRGLRSFQDSLHVLKIFDFLTKPEQIGGVRAFWLGTYWTEHVFTKLKS